MQECRRSYITNDQVLFSYQHSQLSGRAKNNRIKYLPISTVYHGENLFFLVFETMRTDLDNRHYFNVLTSISDRLKSKPSNFRSVNPFLT